MKKAKTIFNYALLPILLTFSSGIIFIACDQAQKPATGQEDEIIVFADSTEFYQLENSLLTVFGKIIYTPQPENLFLLTRKNIVELEKYRNRKNIILIAPLNSESEVGKYINGMLSSDVKELINSDSISVINKYNLWARNQLLMVLTAPTMEKLNQSILNEHENLLHHFQKISDNRLFQSLYNERFERKDIEAKFLKNYGWMIYVQSDFYLALDESGDNFVWLRRSPGTDMERWIFVHWIENASPAMLNRDTVYSIRDRITEKFYKSSDDQSYVEISDDYKTTLEVNFLNRYALMTQGLWRMNDGSMGGPFTNYTFYDQPTKRLYMLDGSIYAPKYYKKKLIQQVDVILQSFLTEREVKNEVKEKLMKELK
ncbi:MAG: DUF4837 family protein [Melioribacteraceae bacterium]|jgi:hypothetical protein|nr:DUF4837 family protein [Melioribacteraceae bacterium]